MYLKYVLDEGALAPTKAHMSDAGFDLYNKGEDVIIQPGGSVIFDTGVHIEIPSGMVGFLKSKSGLNVKQGIVSEGVIDAGYTGSIVVKLYNHGEHPYVINSKDKISQIVFLPIPTINLRQVSSLNITERGDNGFGSSGK